MSRKGEGNQWQQKGFSVFMHTEDYTPPPCQNCVNNKYHGGSVEICDACKDYKNFKAKGKK